MDQVDTQCMNHLSGTSAHFFMTLIGSLIAKQCLFNIQNHYPENYAPKLIDNEEFDFIIVGGGTAGPAAANKLSENGKWSVLLVEAGDLPNSDNEVPSMLFEIHGTKGDWSYRAEPSKQHSAGLRDQRSNWPRGKVLGGCSAINAMIYLRGNKRDYDNWEKLGNPGWSYDDVLPIFKKFENLESDVIKPGSYGKGGELELTLRNIPDPIRNGILLAAQEIGLKPTKEEKPLGFFDAVQNIKDGQRFSAARAFLKNRENLKISLNTFVTKINFDKNKATGVLVKIRDKILNLKIRKELILSAGSVNTPQLLMLSGIGPETHLKSLNIPVVTNLKGVGENMQDHILLPVLTMQLDNSAVKLLQPQDMIDELYKYFMHRSGPFSSIGLTNFVGFVNTENDSDYPNIQIHHILHHPNDRFASMGFGNNIGYNAETLQSYMDANTDKPLLLFLPTLLNPKSAGTIRLKSSDANDKPIINPNYLSDENNEDIATLLKGIRYVDKLLGTDALRKFNPQFTKIALKNCDDLEFLSDEYWKCALRNAAVTIYHPVGTAKMGPASDSMAVVDHRLKVHGIDNVRVIDASIMPKIVSVNTHGPTLMIGYKGGEMIVEDWENKKDEL